MRKNYGFYFILDQMLYREPPKVPADPATVDKGGKSALNDTPERATDKKSDQGLGWFGRVGFEPQDRNLIGFYLYVGGEECLHHRRYLRIGVKSAAATRAEILPVPAAPHGMKPLAIGDADSAMVIEG